MNHLNRRQLIKTLGSGVALAAAPFVISAQTTGHVVVIGGGFGGATAAKYLRLWSGNTVNVTLVDPATAHISCIGSNLVLNDQSSLASLTRSYATLFAHGVTLVTDRATSVDPVNHKVHLAGGGTLPYDHVILSPGIDFLKVDGLTPDSLVMPHAWKAGPQTTELRRQLMAMRNGGTFVITIPKTPFRAHAAPYERACVVADFFRRNKPASKVLILDTNGDFAAMKTTFTAAFVAFNATHPGIVTHRFNESVISVHEGAKTLTTSIGTVTGDVFNVIPPQQANLLAFASGLVPAGGKFAPVNPLNYESTLFPGKGVHVLGDAQATGQAKSGHMANSQAKVCVDAILRALASPSVIPSSLTADPAPKTSAVAFPFITRDTASWSSTTYALVGGVMTAVVTVPPGEAPRPTSDIREEGAGWLTNLLSDTFT